MGANQLKLSIQELDDEKLLNGLNSFCEISPQWQRKTRLSYKRHLSTRKYKPISPKMEVRKFSNLLMVDKNGPFHCKGTLIPPAGKDSWEVVKTFYSKLENSSLIYELVFFLWRSKQGCHNLLQAHGYFSLETKFKK